MQTKLTIAICTCLISLSALAQQETYTIKGKIGNVDGPATIYLHRVEGGGLDSAVMNNGRFEFTGTAEHATLATLLLNHEGPGIRRLRDYLSVYLHQCVKVHEHVAFTRGVAPDGRSGCRL